MDDALLDSAIRSLSDSHCDFLGPKPPSNIPASDPNELLGTFASSQRQIGGSLPVWTDQKIERKGVWRNMGVPDNLLVPTLYAGELQWDGTAVETPEFVDDGEGGYAPSLEPLTKIFTPADPSCRATLRSLLLLHKQMVLKPSIGANSKGVLLLSSAAEAMAVRGEAELTTGQPIASDASNASIALNGSDTSMAAAATPPAAPVAAATRAGNDGNDGDGSVPTGDCCGADDDDDDDALRVWVGSPIKTYKAGSSVSSVPYSQLWRENIIRNPLLRGAFLAEPSIPHDQEL